MSPDDVQIGREQICAERMAGDGEYEDMRCLGVRGHGCGCGSRGRSGRWRSNVFERGWELGTEPGPERVDLGLSLVETGTRRCTSVAPQGPGLIVSSSLCRPRRPRLRPDLSLAYGRGVGVDVRLPISRYCVRVHSASSHHLHNPSRTHQQNLLLLAFGSARPVRYPGLSLWIREGGWVRCSITGKKWVECRCSPDKSEITRAWAGRQALAVSGGVG